MFNMKSLNDPSTGHSHSLSVRESDGPPESVLVLVDEVEERQVKQEELSEEEEGEPPGSVTAP